MSAPPLLDQPVPARRKLLTPRDRFFWWYALSLLFLGPFGFLVGPLMAQRGTRKVGRLYPAEARVAQARIRVRLVAMVGHDHSHPDGRIWGLRRPERAADVSVRDVCAVDSIGQSKAKAAGAATRGLLRMLRMERSRV